MFHINSSKIYDYLKKQITISSKKKPIYFRGSIPVSGIFF